MSQRRLLRGFAPAEGNGAGEKTKSAGGQHPAWFFRDNEWRMVCEDGEEAGLLFTHRKRLPLKDFGAEVRAPLDVSRFLLQQSAVLLDVTENEPERLIGLLLSHMVPDLDKDEARSVLFTQENVPLLARTIQGTCINDSGGFDYDQSWICALCNLPSLQRRHVGIVRLKQATNMGTFCQEGRLFILVLCPSKEKGTKNALETGRTFATLLADVELRRQLLEARTEDEFKTILVEQSQRLTDVQATPTTAVPFSAQEDIEGAAPATRTEEKWCRFGHGITEDLRRRLPFYWSDFADGIYGHKTLQKVCSSTVFLYFACILPSIAFGALNDYNTRGKIDVKKVIVGQTIGGLFQALLGGQPLLILLTTAPLSLYIKVIFSICEDLELDFYAMYACVGLWCSFFLVLFALLDVSRLMRWCTRSTEEIFCLFISTAFCVDAVRDTIQNFRKNYSTPACSGATDNTTSAVHQFLSPMIDANGSLNSNDSLALVDDVSECNRASSILFLLLMLATVWIGLFLYNFTKTPYLPAGKREALADYALPVAVLVSSFIGSYLLQDVTIDRFRYDDKNPFTPAEMNGLTPLAVLGAAGLGFALAVLIFMDQNISSAMVNNPSNKLKKGPAYHLDLFMVALLNAFLSMFGLPWMHGAVPHAPLHVRSLADVEERVDQGHVYEIIVKVRETRLTGIFSHALMGLSLLLLPYPLAYIPKPVLNGLFLYMAITALNGNQMFERILLLFTEQAAYPPSHYIRRVPQRVIHKFTGCQTLQLLVMCVIGFAPFPYVKMMFPFLLLLLLPVRHQLLPCVIEKRYLEALDGQHHH